MQAAGGVLARARAGWLSTVIAVEFVRPCCLAWCVQRIGDTLAAAAFQALVPALGFGPSGMAAACVPVCALWAAVAYRLGRRQQKLAVAAATAKPLLAR